MRNKEKRDILIIFLTSWVFIGEGVWLTTINLQAGIMVCIFFICGFAFLFKLSHMSFFKIFVNYRAQRKGKRFYGCIAQIVEKNQTNSEIEDIKQNITPDMDLKMLKKITGTVFLKIVIYDELKNETKLVDYEVSTATVINENLNIQQYVNIYEYKNKYYMLTDECTVPKFLIPKEYRREMKKYLDNYLSVN